jgi:hypothetical protein
MESVLFMRAGHRSLECIVSQFSNRQPAFGNRLRILGRKAGTLSSRRDLPLYAGQEFHINFTASTVNATYLAPKRNTTPAE